MFIKTQKKKIVLFILILIICIAPIQSHVKADQYISSWAKEAVYNSLFYEVAYSEYFEDFKNGVTRQEFAMMAINIYRIAKDIEFEKVEEYTFDDISNAKYKDEIQIAKNLGIVKGYSESEFGPNDLVSRQQICVMIYRLLQKIEPEENYSNIDYNNFIDRNQIASWAIKEVNYVYNEEIMTGTGQLQISPLSNTTREQSLTLLYRLLINNNYISGITDELMDSYDLTNKSITVKSLTQLDDYLRDSILERKREIRLEKTDTINENNIKIVLSNILKEFKDIGHYYVPNALSYYISDDIEYYSLSIRYDTYNEDFLVYSEINSTLQFNEELLKQVRTGNDEKAYKINFDRLNDGEIILNQIETLLLYNPELNYVKEYGYAKTSDKPDVYNIKFQFAYSEEETKDIIKSTLEKANEISKNIIKSGMTMVEKEIAIHDYIVKNVTYSQDIDKNIYVFYENGVLFKNEAVCQGYASTMKLFLGLNGILSTGINGSALSGERHAWNLVKIYGDWYHLDVTWDDPLPDKPGETRYTYFNLPDSIMSLDHNWDKKDYDMASEIKYNYFYVNGHYFKTEDEIQEFMIESINEGKSEIYFMIEDYSVKEIDVRQLFRNAVNYSNINEINYEISIDENIGVIRIKII